MTKNSIIIFISFFVQINFSLASQQVLTCGSFIDSSLPENIGICSNVENCGIKISKDQYLSPWMELWLNASSQPPSLTFLEGIPTFLKLSSEDVVFSRFEMKDESLDMIFTTFGGKDPILVEFAINANVQATDIKGSLFFLGTLKAQVATGDSESLPFACLYQ